ncbi:ABC transporter substrate-binding protein [Modestobacter sp. VKM Ac-2983]|uniref:ABC transporter substrate-binding protein n=1 Tax=Modestobacter sp. VKM Ac-2983 TaxID=3004137 RepID=UPI0022AB510A|nr:ABC transporter substrate-binding protein [Modestobacter sp. VKM Ac-2983]MCZ2804632.1 ABC transporter substrate-binding protein [Modestobacter sp. VKM Ac-2983]
MLRTSKSSIVLGSMVIGALVLAGCGGGDDEAVEPAAGAATDELTTVRVGAIPIVDVAPLYLAQEVGIFADHGLEVEPFLAQGGAAIVPAVLSGEAEFGFSNITSLLQAESRGVPLALVAPGPGATGNAEEDFAAVIVPDDSDVQEPADLAGKRIAINSINNISDTVVRETVRQDGGDPSSIEFVELAFPNMVAAVADGSVDAAFAVEPFATVGVSQGMRVVAAPYTQTDEALTVAGYFTSDQYAAENPETVQAFADAMEEAQQYATEHPDEVREVLGSYTNIDPAIAQELTLPTYQTEINRDSVERLLELGVEDGIIPEGVDLENVFADLE